MLTREIQPTTPLWASVIDVTVSALKEENKGELSTLELELQVTQEILGEAHEETMVVAEKIIRELISINGNLKSSPRLTTLFSNGQLQILGRKMYQTGLYLSKNRKRRKALRTFLTARQIEKILDRKSPQVALINLQLGCTYEILGNRAMAVKLFNLIHNDRRLTMDERTPCFEVLARYYEEKNNLEKALPFLKKSHLNFRIKHPTNVREIRNQTMYIRHVLNCLGRKKEAERYL